MPAKKPGRFCEGNRSKAIQKAEVGKGGRKAKAGGKAASGKAKAAKRQSFRSAPKLRRVLVSTSFERMLMILTVIKLVQYSVLTVSLQ